MSDYEKIRLPKMKKGRPTALDRTIYESKLRAFSHKLQEIQFEMTGSTHVKEKEKVSSRGWCYLLEGFRIINKDEFGECESIINLCRKGGYIPIDFVAQDESRGFYNVEDLTKNPKEPREWIFEWLKYIEELDEYKDDIAFWESQEYYIQMIVEKIDIRNLFTDICDKYHIPIANAKGWNSINSRNIIAQRFKEAEGLGLKPVLLYYGDFDPAGLLIADKLKKTLKDLEKGTGWNPDSLIVDKFGLTYKFIEENDLLWIDNLTTGSGRNLGELYKRYKVGDKKAKILGYEVEYIEKYGVKKCEANAVLTKKDITIADCEKIVQKYLGENPFEEYDKKLKETKQEVKEILEGVNFKERILEIIEDIEEKE